MDNPRPVGLLARMSQPEKKYVTPVSLAVDAILVVAFFAYMYSVLRPHVPSNDGRMVMLWAGLTSACMTGVFWLCIHMFRVVLRAQRESRRK